MPARPCEAATPCLQSPALSGQLPSVASESSAARRSSRGQGSCFRAVLWPPLRYAVRHTRQAEAYRCSCPRPLSKSRTSSCSASRGTQWRRSSVVARQPAKAGGRSKGSAWASMRLGSATPNFIFRRPPRQAGDGLRVARSAHVAPPDTWARSCSLTGG